MSITKVEAFKTTDGKVFLTEEEALCGEADYELHSAANALADRIRPAYGNADEIAEGLLTERELVMRLATAMRRAP